VTEPKISSSGIVDVDFGESVHVVQPVNLYGCTIGDGSFIGPFVEIQKNVQIGCRCKIQSHSFVCELVTIGDDSVVAHGVMFINDRFKSGQPAQGNKDIWEKTNIGRRVYIGSNSTILSVSICDDVVIGAGSVVTRDIVKSGVYAGNPARFIRGIY
jgi:acetyltransferase-like isoleucine patch superfamily enzyme